jgi:hypothetical protein
VRRVSVLRDRIIGQSGNPGAGGTHPYGTRVTPMVMPLALVTYDGISGEGTYQDLHAATGDVNAVPLAVVAPGTWGTVRAAGRP